MTFTGRYHLVRNWWLPTGEVSAPIVLDRRDRTLRPYLGGEAKSEWEPYQQQRECVRKLAEFQTQLRREPSQRRRLRMAERIVERDADCSRLAAFFGKDETFPLRILPVMAVMGAATNISLNNVYLAGTSGNAIASRFQSLVSKTLNSVYFYIASYTGTAANVDDINLELRPENSAGAVSPNTSSLTEAKTVNPASATGWISSTGWTSVISASTRVFVIVGDADGGGTDFAVLMYRATMFDAGFYAARIMGSTTTGGWASGNTASNQSVKMVLGFSDGTAIGDPFSVNTAPASDTNRRGVLFTASALIANVPIFGMIWSSVSGNISGMEIWAGATGPSGTADNVSTAIVYDVNVGRAGCLTASNVPYTLSAGTAYRIVTTNSGVNTGGPQRIDIGTGEDATLRSAMPGAGNVYYTRANGTSDWSNDLVGSFPVAGLLVDGQVTPPGGKVMVLFGKGP